MSAAGLSNQVECDGLPRWVGITRTVNQDVVVWYTLGVTHIPRPEEWPVMPVTHWVQMIPGGFFSRNPGAGRPGSCIAVRKSHLETGENERGKPPFPTSN